MCERYSVSIDGFFMGWFHRFEYALRFADAMASTIDKADAWHPTKSPISVYLQGYGFVKTRNPFEHAATVFSETGITDYPEEDK